MRTLTQSPTVSAIKGVDILVPRARCFLVTWSGNEGPWKQPLPDVRKFLTSGRACAVVTNITAHARNGFLSFTTPLGERVYFLSSEWLLWDVSKMHHFTQLGFTDNLELTEEDSNRNQPNTLLVWELRQLISRLSSELCEFFFSIRLANKHWESNIAKIGKSI